MRAIGVRLALVLAVVSAGLGSLAFAKATEPELEPAPARAETVVLFAVPQLGLGDVDPAVMPNLTQLADDGAKAAANVRTLGSTPSTDAAYATLGAGNRIASGTTAVLSYQASDPLEGQTAADVVGRRTGRDVSAEVVVPRMPAVMSELSVPGGSDPGAMADALSRAGRRTAIVANTATRSVDGELHPRLDAALGVATSHGTIDVGDVSEGLLTANASGPYGIRADHDAYRSAVARAAERADLVLVDPGETVRAAGYAGTQDGERAELDRIEALARTDRLLGDVASDLGDDDLLLVVGTTPASSTWALTPVVASGDRVPAGALHSPSTNRPGLVTLTDLAPTVLEHLDVDVPDGMIGSPLRFRAETTTWDDSRRLDGLLASRNSIDQPMTGAFIGFQTALYLVAMVVLARFRRVGWAGRLLEVGVLTCAAWPLATFVLFFSPRLYALGPGTFVLTWVLAVLIGVSARQLRVHPLDPLLAVCSATVALLVVDLGTGVNLQFGSFFGYPPHTSPRFTGTGNAASALVAGSTTVIAAALVARSRDRVTACWVAAAVAATVVLANGAPWMGANVGSMLSLVPVLALTLWALSGRQIRWRTLAVAGAVTAMTLAVAVGFEALQRPDQRTHIGRFFLRSGDGDLVRSTLERKWDTNMRVLRESLWAWLIPVIAGFSIYVLIVVRGWQRLLPQGSPERTGVIATLAMGVTGWLVNDSGVMVLALASLYLGPYVLLLALRGDALARGASEPSQGSADSGDALVAR
ncbi:hypothetical protein BH23ACT2_BH23ACT2_07660 [soil metagenome]